MGLMRQPGAIGRAGKRPDHLDGKALLTGPPNGSLGCRVVLIPPPRPQQGLLEAGIKRQHQKGGEDVL